MGAVVVREGEVLLIRRGKEPALGRWSVPGGAVRWGERLEEAVVRETREETGVDVAPVESLVVAELFDEVRSQARHHYVVVDYLCAYVSGEPRAASDAAEAAWVRRGDLSGYDLAGRMYEVVLEAFRRARGRT